MRALRGACIVAGGLLSQTSLLAVGGKFAGDGIQIIGVELLQRNGNAPVQQPAARGADLSIGYLANPAVAEIVVVGVPHAHQAPSPEFIQRGHQRVLAE